MSSDPFKMLSITSSVAVTLLIITLLPGGYSDPKSQPVAYSKSKQDVQSSYEPYNNPGFISNPSIYSYTITNPNAKSSKAQQQPKLRPEDYEDENQSENLVEDTNFIKFATNSEPNVNTNGNYQMKGKKKPQVNRNFYFTDEDGEGDGEGSQDLKGQSDLYTTLSGASVTPTQPAPATGCNVDRLAIYKVVLHTYWTRDLFPKHYPDWRPTAQWTKTLGRTHDSAYALYHLGQQATPGIKQFAETGKSDILDSFNGEQQQQQQQLTGNIFKTSGFKQQQQQQKMMQSLKSLRNERSVFDEFNLASITTGAGRSEAKFFVDSNHSMVSLMTRIVPSPDWFIGVDSFELCVGGSWIDTVTVEVDPLDAGTDNGFTFTAPNWPTSPQGVIYRITSRYPAHPAGSFFYPKNKRLPPIATFQFIKLKEYELSEVFNFAEDDRKYETVKTQTHLETEHNHVEMNNELSASIERERQNEISPPPTSVTEHDRIRSKLLANMNPMNNGSGSAGNGGGGATTAGAKGGPEGLSSSNIIPKNDKHALMQNIVQSYQRNYNSPGSTLSGSSVGSSAGSASLASSTSSASSSPSSSSSSLYISKRRRGKRQRDCRVSHWSDWTPCSKTCGIGEMHRYRKVIKHGKRGGRPCPALQESKWCGSEQACHSPSSYFNWSDT